MTTGRRDVRAAALYSVSPWGRFRALPPVLRVARNFAHLCDRSVPRL